jgi:tRNA dimethylallyltransferase
MIKLVVILGPTGVGKSDVALNLAQILNAEIVSADSMQVYKYMDIGTAKPSREKRKLIPHHIIDVVYPDQDFNAGIYIEMAREAIKNISKRGKNIIVVGGTGLYIKGLTEGLAYIPPVDISIRKKLINDERKFGIDYLYKRLKNVDPVSALKIHPNDKYRIIRSLEVYDSINIPLSTIHTNHNFKDRVYEILKIGLSIDRALLYRKIENRVDKMVKDGLVDEVKNLLKLGYDEKLKSMQSLGYKDIMEHLLGKSSLKESILALKKKTKRYAKRQFTWFRSDKEINWFYYPFNIDYIYDKIKYFIEKT